MLTEVLCLFSLEIITCLSGDAREEGNDHLEQTESTLTGVMYLCNFYAKSMHFSLHFSICMALDYILLPVNNKDLLYLW